MATIAKSYIGKKNKELITKLHEKEIQIEITWNPDKNMVVVSPIIKFGAYSKGFLKKNEINSRATEILSIQLTGICRKYQTIINDINWLEENLIDNETNKDELKKGLLHFDIYKRGNKKFWGD